MKEHKKILLVYKFDHPDLYNLKQVIEEQFPQLPVELLNIKHLVKVHPLIYLTNIFYMFKEYPLRHLLGRWKIWRRFWATTYIHRQIQRLVTQRADAGDILFTFQIHSDFDASSPRRPNFVYTDTTNLANLYTPSYTEDKLYSKAWHALEKETYQNAQVTFVRSSHIRRSLLEQYQIPAQKVGLVYSGGNTPILDVDLSRKDYTTQNILFVGVTWERKGGPDLVEAFKSALKVHPQASLTIVGCEPEVDCPNVKIVGKIPVEQVVPYYRQASIFCLPTRLEPFGVVFLEAMSFGLPLVAPRTGAVPDFVEDGRNGYLIEPGDVPAMAAALIKLLNSPEQCRQFGQVGYQLVRERYTWQKVGQRMGEYIRPVLKQWEIETGA